MSQHRTNRFPLPLLLIAPAVFAAGVVGALAFLFASSCGGGSGGVPDSRVPSDLYLLAGQADLVQIALPGGQQKTLLHFNDASIIDPAVSLDGKHIAFVKAPEYTTTTVDFGTDIYMADRDGANPALLVKHARPSELLRYPAWVGDGKTLIFQVQGSAAGGVPTAQIDRFDTTTGKRERYVDNAWTPSTSRDGQTIVYRVTDLTVGKDAFWSQSIAGGQPKQIIASTAKLASFGNATLSPDNSQLAFGAATLNSVAPALEPGAKPVAFNPRPSSDSALHTDGLPEDVWLVASDGSNPRRLVALAADLPSPAWSSDGKLLYVLEGNGLYQISVSNGARKTVAQGIFHGTIVWAPAPP